MPHEIARVHATALKVEVDFSDLGVARTRATSVCHAEVETRDGLTGHGLSYLSDGTVIAQAINAVAAPAILGRNAMAHEKIWRDLYWTMTGSGQSGYACHAISAIDLALWDLKGKALGMPIWQLLGGARERLGVYATLGLPMMTREHLVEMAKRVVARGFKAIKMQVGRPGLDQRSGEKSLMDILRDDETRIAAVRDAVGKDIEIAMDGSCRFDLPHAVELAHRAEAYGIAWYEEPVMQNDVRLMADLRRRTSIPVSAGQNEGLTARFRDMLIAGAVDVIQPNVSVAGGITQCIKIAALADAFNVPIASGGGGCPYHNMHVQAGLANGTMVEYQTSSAQACEKLYQGYPVIRDGSLTLPDAPGLGFEPQPEAIKEFAVA
jgi:L-alanine-DL-glutamate epimerase-like enolase superfamily enzyme